MWFSKGQNDAETRKLWLESRITFREPKSEFLIGTTRSWRAALSLPSPRLRIISTVNYEMGLLGEEKGREVMYPIDPQAFLHAFVFLPL